MGAERPKRLLAAVGLAIAVVLGTSQNVEPYPGGIDITYTTWEF